MTMGTKKELFGIDLDNYLQATKAGKGVILDNLVRQTDMHRISIIRSFRRLQLQSSRDDVSKRGRKEIYDHECMEAIQFIWKSADYCCGDLLHPVIEERIVIAKKHGVWTWNNKVTNKVISVSISTLKRKIPKWRTEPIRRGISTTTPSAIKDAVPLFQGNWKEVRVGSGQIDTVAHCGGSMAGDFIFSCGYVVMSMFLLVGHSIKRSGTKVWKLHSDHYKQQKIHFLSCFVCYTLTVVQSFLIT